jgi:hypothetical protein
MGAHDAARGLQPTHDRHVQVQQDDVGAGAGDGVEHLAAVRARGHDLDAVGLAEQVDERVADQRVVVGDEHPDAGHASSSVST